MGAHDFQTQQYGATAAEAYKDAVQDAFYEEGHNPYNGTISTTGGFILVPLKEGETIDEWTHRVTMDHDLTQKWENCACVADPDEPVSLGRTLWHFAGWAAS